MATQPNPGERTPERSGWSSEDRPGHEQFFRAVFEQSTIGVAIVELDGRPALSNAALQRFLGYTAAELNALTYHAFTYPDDLSRDAELAATLIAGKVDHYVIEKRYVRKDRAIVWGRLTASLLRTAAGQPQFVLAMVEDIDDRKRAERTLRESDRNFREVFATSGVGMALVTPEGRFAEVNEALCRFLGYSASSMLGRHFRDFTHPDDREITHRHMQRLHTGEIQSWQMEKRCLHADGRTLWGLLTLSLVRDASGAPLHVVAQVQDITERRLAQEALTASEQRYRESEARYRGLIELAPDGILVHCDGQIVFANDAAAQLFGADHPDALIGLPVLELVHPDYRDVVAERIGRLRTPSATVPRIEEKLLRRDGTAFYAETVAVGVTYGGLPAVQVVARDITERRRAESAMRDLESQLRHSQKMEAVGQLAGGIAHDFNNLLTVISTYSDFLLEELDEASSLRGDVLEIQRAGGRAISLTRQLLAFSRKQILQPRVLDLNAVVEGVEPMIRRLIGDDIRVVMRSGPRLGRVNADQGQIEQVLMNLAVNARDAMTSGGTLSIETTNVRLDDSYAIHHPAVIPGEYVMLTVSDTGSGMDEAIRSRVFEPFFTTKDIGRGTGLGLSTVFGIVKQSGGYIWCYSEPGNGTVFKVYLPRTDCAESMVATPSPVGMVPAGSEVLLLVEDETAVRALARRILERYGYTILEARDGADALRIAARYPDHIDALVTDIVMPELAGHQVFQALVESRPDLRVLYMSGYTEHDILRRGLVQEDTAFLQKPFTAAALARAVRSVLDGREVRSDQLV